MPLTRTHYRFPELQIMLGVSRRTLYNWIARGELHTVVIGGSRFVTVAEFQRLTAGRAGVPRPQPVPRPRHEATPEGRG